MKKHELIAALAPFDNETDVHIQIETPDGKPFELALKDLVYKPPRGVFDAYVVFTLHQGQKS